jgi:hypothetical protein
MQRILPGCSYTMIFHHVQGKPLTQHLTGRPRSRGRIRRPEKGPTINHLPQPVPTGSSAHAIQLANQIQLQRTRKPRRQLHLRRPLHQLRPISQRPKRLPYQLRWTHMGFHRPASPASRLVRLPRHKLHPRKLVLPRRVIHGLPDFQPGHQAAHLQRGPMPGQSGLR